MGVSTDGQICYGILFEDGYEFPWDEDGDIEDWWNDIHGMKDWKPTVEIYNSEGNYLNGIKPSKEAIDAYYDERRAFKESLSIPPLPVEMVNVCSGDYPTYILAVPSSSKSASRGYPQEFDPQLLKVSEDELQALLGFCDKYELEYDGEPKWYLSSYWG